MRSKPSYATGDEALAKRESAVEAAHHPSPRVGDVMTRDVATCHAVDTLERAAQRMWDRACGSLPVVDDRRRPVAMITDRDVCMAAYTQGKSLAAMVVASAMSGRIFTVDEDAPLDVAQRLMRLHCIRRLPVVDRDGMLVGILSIADVAANARIGPTLGRDGLDLDVITATVAALHHSVRPHAE